MQCITEHMQRKEESLDGNAKTAVDNAKLLFFISNEGLWHFTKDLVGWLHMAARCIDHPLFSSTTSKC